MVEKRPGHLSAGPWQSLTLQSSFPVGPTEVTPRDLSPTLQRMGAGKSFGKARLIS